MTGVFLHFFSSKPIGTNFIFTIIRIVLMLRTFIKKIRIKEFSSTTKKVLRVLNETCIVF